MRAIEYAMVTVIALIGVMLVVYPIAIMTAESLQKSAAVIEMATGRR